MKACSSCGELFDPLTGTGITADAKEGPYRKWNPCGCSFPFDPTRPPDESGPSPTVEVAK